MRVTYEATKKAAELLKGLTEGTQSYILLKTIIAGPKTVEQLAAKIAADDTKKALATAANNARWYLNQLTKAGAVRSVKADEKAPKKAAKKPGPAKGKHQPRKARVAAAEAVGGAAGNS
jgi:hypothetical protein